MRMSFQNTARPFIIAIPKASSSNDEEPKALRSHGICPQLPTQNRTVGICPRSG